MWFSGLKALISHFRQRTRRTESRSDGTPSEANSPRTYTRRSSPLHSPFSSNDSLQKVVEIFFRVHSFVHFNTKDVFILSFRMVLITFAFTVLLRARLSLTRHYRTWHYMQFLQKDFIPQILVLFLFILEAQIACMDI